MASRNAKTPKPLTKTSPAKKAATPTKKPGPASPTKGKLNGEAKGKGKVVNGAASSGAVPKSGAKETKSPTSKSAPPVEPINSEKFSNGVSLNSPLDDPLLDQPLNTNLMIGDIQVVFLTETDTKYINTKHTSVSSRPGDASADVTLEVDGQTFKSHRSILTSASSFFKDLFKGSKSDPVKIDEDIGAQAFENLLDSLYDGYVVLSADTCQAFFDTASTLDISWLIDAGADNVMRTIGPENYQTIARLFGKHNKDSLKQETYNLMAHNLIVFSDSNYFLENLDYDTISNILSSNQYVEGSEGFIVKVILDWVHMDKENRQGQLASLAKLIRYPLLEPEELDGLPPDLTNFPDVKTQIAEAREYGLNPSAQSLYTGEKYCGRGCRDVVALVSASEMNNGNLILYKDLNKPNEPMCVEQLEPAGLKTELAFTAQTSMGNFVYVAGGHSQDFCSSNRMFRFDPRFREWIELAPMGQSRLSFAMCSSDKNIFVVGGIERTVEEANETETPRDSAEIYNPQDNSWKDLPKLPHGCSEHAAAFCDGLIYISGGISSNAMDPIPLDYMNALQVNGGETWESMAPMFTGRQGHSMSTVGGKLVVLGGKCSGGPQGFENCLSTEIYNRGSKQWTKLSSIPEGVGSVSRFVAALGDRVVFIAGQHWHYFDTEKNDFIEGDFCGPEVQRVVSLQVAYPPTL